MKKPASGQTGRLPSAGCCRGQWSIPMWPTSFSAFLFAVRFRTRSVRAVTLAQVRQYVLSPSGEAARLENSESGLCSPQM